LDCQGIHKLPVAQIAPDLTMRHTSGSKIINIDREVEIGGVVGVGGFAKVHQATYKKNTVALKVLTMGPLLEDEQRVKILAEFRQEVKIMGRFNHPCLVRLIGYSTINPPAMVLEFISGGDLYKVLNGDPKTPLSWPLRLKLAWDISAGMNAMHSCEPPLVHRDLKSPNVMIVSLDVDDGGVLAKIADFGLARELRSDSFRGVLPHQRDVANPTWLAPEILGGQPYGLPSDVYAFGVILWELYCQETPFNTYEKMSEMEIGVIQGDRPAIPSDCPPEYATLIKTCWAQKPETRATFGVVKNVSLPHLISFLAPKLADTLKATESSNLFKTHSQTLPMTLSVDRVADDLTIKSMRTINQTKLSRSPGTSPSPRRSNTASLFNQRATGSLMARWTPRGGTAEEDPIQSVVRQLFKSQVYLAPYPGSTFKKHLVTPSDLCAELEHLQGKVKVFNLSASQYDYTVFKNGVIVEYMMTPGYPAPLSLIRSCLNNILQWIQLSKKHFAIVHDDSQFLQSALVGALAVSQENKKMNAGPLNIKAINDCLGISIHWTPSYLRYYGYFLQETFIPKAVRLHKVVFHGIPNFKYGGSCDPVYSVEDFRSGKKLFFKKALKGLKGNTQQVDFFCKDLPTSADLRIEFCHKDFATKMFACSLNIAYLPQEFAKITLAKKDLDFAASDIKHFPKEFSIDLFFLDSSMFNSTLLQQSTHSESESSESSITSKTIFTRPTYVLDPNLPVCLACRKNVKLDQASLTVSVGTVVHMSCMNCDRCGIGFDPEEGEAPESVIRFGRILCSGCDTEFFPPCEACGKSITTNPKTHGSAAWHAECLKCTKCKQVIVDETFGVEAGNTICNRCATKSGLVLNAPEEPIAFIDDMLAAVDQPIAVKHWKQFLEGSGDLLETLVAIVTRKKTPEPDERKTLAVEIEKMLKQLPPPIPESYTSPDPEKLGFDKLFEKPQNAIFRQLSPIYPKWSDSPSYAAYLSELNNELDFEAEEEAARRRLAKNVFPLSPEQEAADGAVLKRQSDRLAAEKAARRAAREAERRRQEAEEAERRRLIEEEERRKREADEAERRRLEEEERQRREAEEAERRRLEEEERKRREAEEAERRRLEEEERKCREAEEERRRKKEEKRRLKREAEEKRRLEEERLRREEEERLRREEEERRRLEEEERLRREEEERRRLEEEERRKREIQEEIERQEEEFRRKPEKKLLLRSDSSMDDETLSHMEKVVSLDLSRNQSITDKSLGTLTYLRSLSLTQNKVITDDAITHLTNLQMLNLDKNQKITNDAISKGTSLISLSLVQNKAIQNQSLALLTNLTDLDISKNKLIKDTTLRQLTNLRSLSCMENELITDASIGCLTKLHYLNCHKGITKKSIILLTGLNELGMHGNKKITDATISTLTNLKKLCLEQTEKITEKSLHVLTNLELLSLQQNKIIQDPALAGLTKLHSLDLCLNKVITDKGILHLSNLTALSLQQCQTISNEISQLTNLKSLNLCGNRVITDQGIKTLTNLNHLNLDYNHVITQNGISHLSNLTLLSVQKSSVPPDALHHLKKDGDVLKVIS